MSRKQKIVKKDPISHVLDRPDMYVGSVRSRSMDEFIATENYKIVKKTIEYSPAVLRIFIEPLSNVIDNVARSREAGEKVSQIRVDIDPETGETSFWNDGLVIPIEKHETEGIYNHTLIFGHLLTSSNYDDTEERYDISGRNGVGVKLTNVFSTSFTVEGVDSEHELKFTQTWTNNMKNAAKPIVKSCKKKGCTKITYTPDFKQFNLSGYTEDIIALYRKYIIDMAMITKVKVLFNGEVVPVKSLVDYAKLYMTEETDEILYINSNKCEVVLTPALEYQAISFANGVCTPLGGTHVDAWSETLFRPILTKLNKPKKPQINIKDVRSCFRIFVIVSVPNPKFESQNKLKLEEPVIQAPFKKSYLTKIAGWSVMARLEDIIRSKELIALKKVERKKRGFTRIPNLDPANKEGGKDAHLCTLILVEGDSAKTYASEGIQVGAFGREGRDWFGIYKLRGKILNCRNCTPDTIAKNVIVGELIKALGLQTGVDYTIDKNYKNLRYGRVLIVTDADVDGIHISSLIQNMFHTLFPTLLKRKSAFLTAMQTPIVKLTIGKKDVMFYDERVYKKYVEKFEDRYPGRKLEHKYYKGLGTSDADTVHRTFGVKILNFVEDEKTTDNMIKVFHKKFADSRKEWLANYDSKDIRVSWDGEKEEIRDVNISDFLNTETIKFSIDDCNRSLPNLVDGLKESQRKILYVAFLKNLRYTGKSQKVAQFGALVAAESGYHHGEQNLFDTLTKMAMVFVGSNNIPLFTRDGQFGSRASNGKDAAQPRYIFTKLEMLSRIIFDARDDGLLKQRQEDGELVEPFHYIPIIPMLLVNGCSTAIGTGWSSTIPSYDPLSIVDAIKTWLECDGQVFEKDGDTTISAFPELKPWYRGFTGEITGNGDKFITHGRVSPGAKRNQVVVEEIPIGMSINKFKDALDGWREEKLIDKYDNHSTPNHVHFTITESSDGFACTEDNLKLTSSITLTNMVVLTEKGQIQKFDSVDNILDEFCKIRYHFYVLRKRNILQKMEGEITVLGNKKRFLEEVLQGKIKLFKKDESRKVARSSEELCEELEERKYDKNEGGYDYLLGMQIRSITAEKIDKLKNDIASCIARKNELESTSEKQLWINDLDHFVAEYGKWLKIVEKELKSKTVRKKRK